MTAKQIAETRNIKEGTVWNHIAILIEFHHLQLKDVLSNYKIKEILKHIYSQKDTLKEIKDRVDDDSISYNDINCVLANVKGKRKKKSLVYLTDWYIKTNCFRKCYFNKNQRQECRIKFQKFIANNLDLTYTKNEFLNFFNNHLNICVLQDKEKRRFISWKEHLLMKKNKLVFSK